MTSGRPAALISTCDQWVRASHHQTSVEVAGEVTLSWKEIDPVSPFLASCRARGLAVDRLCRVYRVLDRVVERLAVGPTKDGLDYSSLPPSRPIIGPNPPAPAAGSTFVHSGPRVMGDFVGIAIDSNDRLFLADANAGTISVIDLWSRRLIRTIQVSTSEHPGRFPMGLACEGDRVIAAVQQPAGLLEFSATRRPESIDLPNGGLPLDAVPRRVGILGDGSPVVLFDTDSGFSWIASAGTAPRWVGPASDLIVRREVVGDEEQDFVVVAPCSRPDGRASLLQFVQVGPSWQRSFPLDVSGYDGNGILATADGRVGYFTTEKGFRLAVGAEVRYEMEGHCVSYRLDSGVARNRWGRVLIEACVPDGTAVLVSTMTSDDEASTELAHNAPEPSGCEAKMPNPGPLPPLPLVPALETAAAAAAPLHERADAVTPWLPSDDVYRTLEAPVFAEPGRYLWVTVALRGNQRRTPRVREVRIERSAHQHMRRLPEVFSADPSQEEFLDRYLAMPDGFLHDLQLRSECRDLLVDPSGTPVEALNWLASFVGLILDDRWASEARRRLISEIVPLYRYRGTQWALGRYIEIYLMGDRALDLTWRAVQPIIVEHYRLRGAGGPLLSEDPNLASRAVVGAGFRVGGAVGDRTTRPLDGTDAREAYESHAHRFTVLIPQSLSAEQNSAIRFILDTERPAHTVYDLCTVDAGMRVGNGLHVGMSSIVGPTGAFESAVTDRSLIGRGAILGGRSTGVSVEASRVGQTARVG